MARQILVPVDGSTKSTEGLEYALSTYGDESITVLHVMTPHDMSDSGDPSRAEVDDWYDDARETADAVLADAQERAAAHDVSVETAVEVGEPWRAIVEYVEDEAVDHVIMGSHGRSDDSPVPLGSVAETVMRRSPVLVSIVR